MSGAQSLPTPFLNATRYAWTEEQLEKKFEEKGVGEVLKALRSTPGSGDLTRADLAERVGLVNIQTLAIETAGG